jgi:hypothetical protein
MKRWNLVAAAVAVAGVAWFGVDRTRASSPRPQSQARDTAGVAAPPPNARPLPRAVPPRVQPPALMRDPPDPGEVVAADTAKPDPTDQEIAQALDGALRAEAVDPAWGKAMETRVGDYLRSERATGSSLVRAECRSTLCKLEVQHTGVESAEHFVDDVSSFIPKGSNAVIQPGRDGTTTHTVVWFTRHGPAPMP